MNFLFHQVENFKTIENSSDNQANNLGIFRIFSDHLTNRKIYKTIFLLFSIVQFKFISSHQNYDEVVEFFFFINMKIFKNI